MKNGVRKTLFSLILSLTLQYNFVCVRANDFHLPEQLDKLPNLSYGTVISAPPVMIIRSWRFVGMNGSAIQNSSYETILNDSSGTATMEIFHAPSQQQRRHKCYVHGSVSNQVYN